jgi:iron complex outermembrane recepter protein
LTMDGVRIYLPADNRLDFARFLTADIAAVQIQKGYASVLDGPGGMGGAINLVTVRPTKKLEVEGGISGGGHDGFQGSNGYGMVGTRQERFYAHASVAYADRDAWRLSNDYQPVGNSLQPAGERLSSDTSDWSANLKAGYTPNATDEYTVNYMKQSGEKGAPLNVYTNPLVPPNSFWRWPYWDIANLSFLSNTQIGTASYVRTKLYANTFQNGLNAYDDITYTTQSLNGRFFSPYDDHAYGGGAEFGTTPSSADTIKASFYYRTDNHKEGNVNRPTSPATTTDPTQERSQYTWSIAGENTFHVAPTVDIVAGISYDKYEVTGADGYTAARGLFSYPTGGADAFNWQAAGIWRYRSGQDIHVTVSDRARFPILFELYSTRFGTGTPNPDVGPESATNVEVGWAGTVKTVHLSGAVFHSNVHDLIQTVVLPDTTTQYQNVGTGTFYGAEIAVELHAQSMLSAGANYTYLHREIHDALQPNLQPTGAPGHKAFLYATWRPWTPLAITPSLDIASDRWSDMTTNPVQAFPYIETGAYELLGLDTTYALSRTVDLAAGGKNLLDQNYELAWGYPQPGRTFYVKTRVKF